MIHTVYLVPETIQVICILNTPFLMEKTGSEKLEGNDRYEGYMVDLANAIMEKTQNSLMFNISLMPPESFHAVFDRIMNGSADMIFAEVSLTAHRVRMGVEYSIPFMTSGTTLLGKLDQKTEEDGFYFLNPVSNEVWISVGLAYITVSFFLFIIARISPTEKMYHERETKLTFLNSFWFSLAALVGQGSEIIPRSFASRILVAFWWGFILIVVNSYTANLAAFQTAQLLETKIGSLEDLVNQQTVDYGIYDDSTSMRLLQNSSDPVKRRAYNYLNSRTEKIRSFKVGLEKVKQGNFIYLGDAAEIEYEIQSDCSLTQIGEVFNIVDNALAFRPDFPHRQMINAAILDLKESHANQKMRENWWKPRNCKGANLSEVGMRSLSFSKMFGIFIFMAIGIVIALVSVFLEYLFSH
ncbi:glutamate receptor ionotropic, kainate 2 isoform X2 [Eurytemora carolleeae]|uniref:glutamate receptor ionotropic, kainate 2 isoform X2 n=1 Tax=Eurytemora carolleeae TaxID=1294199 RepID=UPI000C784219|nr:glutamate receptor ionotropic, kainate 2 isoform X2 [Eurytemora carolleeae]XP_023349473.1 glutamate receptor ionotropic, kainate 2 isoform X2 [Eurytemora carolleeae]XP_023349474.1 glutamate receptor ionotropic, kainate 2 isoform X2 [Eurytemora carolleeae]|eukprot:XP_023349471.1 glutamate receptor ionotropic, kainate 2-like isoform X2 [Eurytemora affinis]